MRRYRSFVILLLFWLPILTFVGAGGYSLWQSGNLLLLWWLLPLCWGLAYLLAWLARSKQFERRSEEINAPAFWTAQDREAWGLVQEMAAAGREQNPAQLTEIRFYMQRTEELSQKLAAFYHPGSKDPFQSLTIPEILAAAQLVIEDLSELVNDYLPGNRYLTVNRWRSLGKLPEWYNAFSNLSYVISAVFGPATTASRYIVSRLIVGPAFQMMQENLLLWFYTSFINRVGMYVIEMNSGRLLSGAKTWRQQVAQTIARSQEDNTPVEDFAVPVTHSVSIAVVGQVKAGKSSLINALLGDRQAAVDILPLTDKVQRYEVREADLPDKLVFLDTVGYSVGDQTAKELNETFELLHTVDIVLLVVDALNPAREPDCKLLQKFDKWFRANPKFKRPPVLVAMTHIDGLRPMMEWNPPYEGWRLSESPSPKERSIREAVEFNRELMKPFVVDVVPVCGDFDGKRVYGVDDWLFPEIVALLDEARAVLLVRTLHGEAKRHHWSSLMHQVQNLGLALLKGTTTIAGPAAKTGR